MAPADLAAVTNYYEISSDLGTAGQPRREQFQALRNAGYQVVINLARPDSPSFVAEEAELAAGLGLEYVPIPVVWEAPQPQDFARFAAEMQRLAGKKVFVHCALNYRASAFVYLYRILFLGAAEEEARRDMLAVWQPEGVWADLIARVRRSGPFGYN